MTITPGDVVNQWGDLYRGPHVPPLATGLIWVNFRQAVQAANYGWRFKAAMALVEGGELYAWIMRGDGQPRVRRR